MSSVFIQVTLAKLGDYSTMVLFSVIICHNANLEPMTEYFLHTTATVYSKAWQLESQHIFFKMLLTCCAIHLFTQFFFWTCLGMYFIKRKLITGSQIKNFESVVSVIPIYCNPCTDFYLWNSSFQICLRTNWEFTFVKFDDPDGCFILTLLWTTSHGQNRRT